MTRVVDASVAMKWLVEEDGSDKARDLLSAEVEAPDLLIPEVCNALWRLQRVGALTAVQYAEAVIDTPRFFNRFWPLLPLAPRAAHIAVALDHAVYDCFYLALAEQRNLLLVTADRRLLNRVAGSAWKDLVVDLYALPA